MILAMVISLYTSRIVLQQLGVIDYGIYNVVGGVVSMFAFLNSSMASSTQRFLTIELGKGNIERLNLTFNTSFQIHLLIALCVAIITEMAGLWFMSHKMQIPLDRMDAAYWVFQFAVLSMIITFINVPYTAIIIAYEKMGVFAYITIVEVGLKLLVAYLLVIAPFDKLKFYAVLMFICPLIVRAIYGIYCRYHISAVRLKKVFNRQIFKEMSIFAGWSLWGQIASIFSTQGINILLNVFFGPTVNAARGIAIQVQGAVSQFSANFQTAVNPQITKSYAVEDWNTMHSLIYRSSKFTYFMLLALAMPISYCAPFLIQLWLGEVPDHTVSFLRIILWITIIDAMANPLMVAASASGSIKKYQSVVGGILLLILPIAYIVLKLGASPQSVFLVHLIICIIAFITRLYIVRPLIKLSIAYFISQVIGKCIVTTIIAMLPPTVLFFMIPEGYGKDISVMVTCFFSVLGTSYYLGLDVPERQYVKLLINSFLRRSR